MRNWLLAIALLLLAGFVGGLAGWILWDEGWSGVLLVGGATMLICTSGGLASYFNYKRGKIYAKRGQSGPDD